MRTRVWVAPLIRFFSNLKIRGKDNIPKEGGYILACNHIGIRDVFLMGAACPRQIKFIAKKELFSIPIIRGIMKSVGAVKLDRGGSDIGAIRTSIDLINSADLVAIFPQGHRYPSVEPAETPLKSGVGLLAYRTKADVIPVCIKTKNHRYSFFAKKEIIFGKPIPYSALGLKNGGSEEYAKATSIIFSKIIELGGFQALPKPKEDTTIEGNSI